MEICWILECVKVFCGYIFLMFIWPTVVFWKYLKDKKAAYRFSFCVTAQIVIINAVVLLMGLLHILNGIVVVCIFYGTFLVQVWKMSGIRKIRSLFVRSNENKFQKLRCKAAEILTGIKAWIKKCWAENRSKLGECVILLVVLIFGMAYFSYGAFQMRCYGFYDIFTHHRWINSLVEGNIFPDGIYPEAMHCFVYCIYTLFGIRIHSILMFLQCIHVAVFLLSAYFFLREVFHWKYSPVFVLGLYLTLNFVFEYSMSRLQATYPMEFGLHTQFLCVLYLIRFLKKNSEKPNVWKEYFLIKCWDEDLLLFVMALSASLVIHFYNTIMAFMICVSFSLFNLRKIFVKKKIIPLGISILCGCAVAVFPMAGAYATGTSLEGSLYWGLNSVNTVNEDNESLQETSSKETTEVDRGPFGLVDEDLEVTEKLPLVGQKVVKAIIHAEYLIKETYQKGYQGMYTDKRGDRIFKITLLIMAICLLGKSKRWQSITGNYMPVILLSFMVLLNYAAYTAPELGIPVLISDYRFCSFGHMIVLAVMIMPADILFSIASELYNDIILQIVSVAAVIGIYIYANSHGIFHKYLYFMVPQYNIAVEVTNSIIDEFPRDSYTIISPLEEEPLVALYGNHEEIWQFLETCSKGPESISTQYIFIYVEKRPVEYYQVYHLNGPAWLGIGEKSEIKASEISRNAAEEDMSYFGSWYRYGKGRTVLESKAYKWCEDFSQRHPLQVYYEDENFVCYYIKQDVKAPYALGVLTE